MSKIPCTVGILTHNSAETLPRALESVKDFAEIIIVDGNSTDATLEIARQYGARVIPQDPAFLDPDGRIIDFGSVRNQALRAASERWFLYIDSDEYIGPELRDEVRSIVTGEPAAYWVPRRYVYKGDIIECSTGYPNRQVRLFHRSFATGFIKTIHERIALTDGAPVRFLKTYMYVPVPDDVESGKEKWRSYIALEMERRQTLPLRRALKLILREGAIGARFFFRWIGLIFCRGTRMPLRNEFMRVWYQWTLVKSIVRRALTI